MKTAAVSRLKASLSEYLAKVKAGEEVVITDQGKPIAKLVPFRRAYKDISPHLAGLEMSGAVRLGTGKLPDEFWTLSRIQDKKGLALSALLKERE